MLKKIIAVKSKKTKIVYFIFEIKTVGSKQLAYNSEESDFEFTPIYQGTSYEEAKKLKLI